MIPLYKLEDLQQNAYLQRQAPAQDMEVEQAVSAIISKVKAEGDQAVQAYTLQFDGVSIPALRVSAEEIASALTTVSPDLFSILQNAAENITAYHKKQVRQGFLMTEKDGVVLGQKITPIAQVGVYVPGGTASYPSTVLMDIIPAKLAGVSRIVMCTPPGKDGKIPSAILAAAHIAGVDEIYKAGGAQAVAAMAMGTESIAPVDKIIGPGNIYVATAKRQVFGLVDIDMIAGPSDILIIGDASADPTWVSADLLAQAEHDRRSRAIFLTTSASLAKAVQTEVAAQLAVLPRRAFAQEAIENNSMIVITPTLEAAVTFSNAIAPEHLQLCTQDPFALLSNVQNAGSIFLGNHTPEALADYFAGPNHTLPTMGTARFSSALSVDDFVKKSSITYYSQSALQACIPQVAAFARSEGLEGHARSMECRQKREETIQ